MLLRHFSPSTITHDTAVSKVKERRHRRREGFAYSVAFFFWVSADVPGHTGPSWSPAKSGGTLKDSWFQFQFQFRFQCQFQFRFQFQFQFSFSVSFSFSFGCSFSSVSVSVSVQFSLVFSVSFSLSSVSVSVQFRLGFLYFLGRPWGGSGGEGRCVVEIFYISVSIDTHTSRHHWGVIVPLGARHVSRPSRHRSIGPGVTTLGSIVLDDCQWAESGKCGPILMMMPDTCFPRD